MNRGALIEGIDNALPLLNTFGGTENVDFLLYDAANEPAQSDPRLINLLAMLRAEPELETFNGYMQVVAGTATRVEYTTLAAWLLKRAKIVGPPQAIADLECYLASDQLPFTFVFVISGIKLVRSCSLGSGIEFLPWDAAPESIRNPPIYKRLLRGFPIHLPTATLLRPVTISKSHVREVDSRVDFKVHEFINLHEEMKDFLLCVSLIGPCAPYILASWFEPPEWAPTLSGSYMFVSPEGRAITKEWPIDGCERAGRLFSAFCRLPLNCKMRLRLAIERLNSAMRRFSTVDSAIDLGIVFEVLFLNDRRGDQSELAFRLRLRGARFLETDYKERRRVFHLLRDLYRLRSIAVHEGCLPEKIKGIKISVQDLLEQGFSIAAAALERFISDGDPDWDQLTLN